MSRENPVGCHTCISACCRSGIKIALAKKELDFLESGGSTLKAVMRPEEIAPTLAGGKLPKRPFPTPHEKSEHEHRYMLATKLRGHDPSGNSGFYAFQGDCGYLGTNNDGTTYCKVHDDERRPAICRYFPEGSKRCMDIRFGAGLDR